MNIKDQSCDTLHVCTSNTNVLRPIVLSSGGTGGHLFPALSVADEIEKSGRTALLVTDNRGVLFFKNHKKKPALVCTIHRKHWLFGRLVYPFSLGFQILKCFIWLKRVKPAAVIGFGGYPSFPCTYAAQWLKIPTVLHEGNAFLGKANRALAPKAERIALSFPPSESTIVDERYYVTGNPVRGGIRDLISEAYQSPDVKGDFQLLVIGGSQGAKIFSQLLPQAVQKLSPELQKRLVITQQCREPLLNDTQIAYAEQTNCRVELKTFLSPIENYYKTAHLVIARAGASTVAEVSIAGKPTLFVPFQGSVEGDQAQNAAQLMTEQAAWVLRESSINADKLAAFLKEKMEQPESLAEKAALIRTFAHPKAAQSVWQLVTDVLEKS
jgi:UDP-N-acetylglucosamine--N-acetylmuramyl-(pentapeptide) pyrophosphoryl-undecaprenol N-acetylglucosamine transferase